MSMKRITLSLIASVLLCYAGEVTLKTKVQPLLRLEQKGSSSDSGEVVLGFNRVKLYSIYEKKLSSEIEMKSTLSLDFSKKEIQEILKEVSLSVQFQSALSLIIGQYKVPFLHTDYCGSGSLSHVDRSYTSQHLREELALTGYKVGLSLGGEFLEGRLGYTGGLFYDEELDQKGIQANDIFMLPSILLYGNPIENLRIEYGVLIPEFYRTLIDGSTERKRIALHAISVSYEAPKLYSTDLDIFLGADTTTGRELMSYQSSYNENCVMSIYSNHSFTIPVKEQSRIELALAGEFLNGLTYYNGRYNDRLFNYALFATAAYEFRKNLRVEISLNERFDKEFQEINEKTFALQCTYAPTLLRWRK